MRKYQIITIKAIIVMVILAASNACKNSPPTQTVPTDEVEVIIPCSGTEFFGTAEIFRANSIGESSDQVVSKKKALSNARADLAAQVESTVKAVTDNYVNSREYNNKEEVEERFENLSREVVNQELRGTKVICEKQTRTSNGTYKSYIALELDTNAILTAYDSKLSTDERLKIDYDYEKFKKTFEEEMNKMKN